MSRAKLRFLAYAARWVVVGFFETRSLFFVLLNKHVPDTEHGFLRTRYSTVMHRLMKGVHSEKRVIR